LEVQKGWGPRVSSLYPEGKVRDGKRIDCGKKTVKEKGEQLGKPKEGEIT